MANGKETNQIDNKRIKEGLGDAALASLKQGEHYDELAGLQLEFGYLFTIEDHGLEALFRITTDKQTIYFAAQKNKLMMLNIDEAQFNAYTRAWYEYHG
jgi:hypothetical protein